MVGRKNCARSETKSMSMSENRNKEKIGLARVRGGAPLASSTATEPVEQDLGQRVLVGVAHHRHAAGSVVADAQTTSIERWTKHGIDRVVHRR